MSEKEKLYNGFLSILKTNDKDLDPEELFTSVYELALKYEGKMIAIFRKLSDGSILGVKCKIDSMLTFIQVIDDDNKKSTFILNRDKENV